MAHKLRWWQMRPLTSEATEMASLEVTSLYDASNKMAAELSRATLDAITKNSSEHAVAGLAAARAEKKGLPEVKRYVRGAARRFLFCLLFLTDLGQPSLLAGHSSGAPQKGVQVTACSFCRALVRRFGLASDGVHHRGHSCIARRCGLCRLFSVAARAGPATRDNCSRRRRRHRFCCSTAAHCCVRAGCYFAPAPCARSGGVACEPSRGRWCTPQLRFYLCFLFSLPLTVASSPLPLAGLALDVMQAPLVLRADGLGPFRLKTAVTKDELQQVATAIGVPALKLQPSVSIGEVRAKLADALSIIFFTHLSRFTCAIHSSMPPARCAA